MPKATYGFQNLISIKSFLFGAHLILCISAPITLLASSDKLDDFDRLFAIAVSQHEEAAASEDILFYRWNLSTLHIGLFVEGTDSKKAWKEAVESFQDDRRIFENNTGKRISVGLWGDTDPSPNIFVIIGDRYELLQRADHLGKLVYSPEFGNQLRQQFADRESMCNSIVAFDQPGSMVGALITVEKDRDPAYCFRRQLMVAFGLIGDLPEDTVSILSVDQNVLQLSKLDKSLLQRLYSLDLPEPQ